MRADRRTVPDGLFCIADRGYFFPDNERCGKRRKEIYEDYANLHDLLVWQGGLRIIG